MTAQEPDIRFMVDHMLVKLGKYLRIIGCDAEWDLGCRTQELIPRANLQRRVFLTRNTKLKDEYPPVDRAFIVSSEDPVEQLDAVAAEFRLDRQARLFSRCIRCNVVLEAVPDKSAIRSRVHPNVFDRYEQFFTCPACHTVFWKGSHVRNTCRKLGIELP